MRQKQRALFVSLAILLMGCGQKGPLTLHKRAIKLEPTKSQAKQTPQVKTESKQKVENQPQTLLRGKAL